MYEPLVSVITPTYNCGAFIAKTIESVQAQTYTNWEMLIVDDCSTDDTREVVAAYADKDSRIHYTCLEHNSGAAVARTTAMQQAKGAFMAFLDSDDLWMPDKLEKQLAFIFGKTVTTVQGIIPVVKLLYHDVIARNNPRQYCIKSSYGEIPDKILGIKALQHFKYKQKILNLLKNTSGLSCREITEHLSVGTQEKIRALLYELRKEKKIYLKKVKSNKWIYLHMDNYVEEDE